jgi:hypothetical protein
LSATFITSIDLGLWPTVHLAAPEGNDHVRVFASPDGGVTWTSGPSPHDGGPDGFMDATVQFVDPSDGFLEAVFATNTSQSLAELLRTADGGATWRTQKLPVSGAIEFSSVNDGWLLGGTLGNQFFRTRDGGITWTAVTIPVPPTAAGHKAWPMLPAVNGDQLTMPVAFEVDGGGSSLLGMYLSHDGGTTWAAAGPLTMLSADGSGGPIAVAPGFILAVSPAAQGFLSLTVGPESGATPVANAVASNLVGAGTGPADNAAAGLEVTADGAAWSLETHWSCQAPKVCQQSQSLWASADRGVTWTELHP